MQVCLSYSMEPFLPKHDAWDDYAVGFPMVIWAVTFFLPALYGSKNNWFFPETTLGYGAAFGSFLYMIFILVLAAARPPSGPVALPRLGEVAFFFAASSLWLANLWMIIAPAMSKRLGKQQGQFYLFTLWLWVLIPAPIPIQISSRHMDLSGMKLAIGFYIWWASFLLLALICTGLYQRARYIRIAPYPRRKM